MSWNTAALTLAALESVHKHASQVCHEIIVIDNASADGSADAIASSFPDVKLICNTENVGFGRANNQGMSAATGKTLLLLNSDAELVDDSLGTLLSRLDSDPKLGVAHCTLVSPDGSQQFTTYRFPSLRGAVLENLGLIRLLPRRQRQNRLGAYWNQSYERDVEAVAGAFMLLKREVYETTGGFDPAFFLYGEDIEWCHRIWNAGWRIRYYPDARVLHHNHASTNASLGDRRRLVLQLHSARTMITRRSGVTAGVIYPLLVAAGALYRIALYSVRSVISRNPTPRAILRFQCTLLVAALSVFNSWSVQNAKGVT